MILASIPGQLFNGSEPSAWGIAATAALLTGLSVWCAIRLWGWTAGLVTLTMTPLLYTVGRTLWPETICIPLLLLGIMAVRADRRLWTLLPLVGFMTLCRPPFGLLAVLVLCIYLGRRRAVLWPVAGFLTGIVTLYVFSRAAYGEWSLVAGYPVSRHIQWSSLWLGTVSFARGVLWWTPWLFFVRPRDRTQKLVLAAAILYLLGVWLTYDAWGGQNLLGYRYPVPLAVLAAHMIVRPTRPALRLLFDLAVTWSIAIAIAGESLVWTLAPNREPWKIGIPIAQSLAVFALVVIATAYYRVRLEPEIARRRQAREAVAVS